MLPLLHLYAILGITLLAYGITRYDRLVRHRQLKHIAGEFELNYSAHDPFGLATKIVDRFPVPGAARLVVTDVLYGTRGDHFQYIFTAHYTIGAVRVKKRLYRVASYVEPLGGTKPSDAPTTITVATETLEWIDQYRDLANRDRTPADTISAVLASVG